jgi:hypothetical protein
MTIFTMKDGKLAPIAIIKGGKTIGYDEFVKAAAAPAAPAAPAAAPAAEPKKDEAKK